MSVIASIHSKHIIFNCEWLAWRYVMHKSQLINILLFHCARHCLPLIIILCILNMIAKNNSPRPSIVLSTWMAIFWLWKEDVRISAANVKFIIFFWLRIHEFYCFGPVFGIVSRFSNDRAADFRVEINKSWIMRNNNHFHRIILRGKSPRWNVWNAILFFRTI